MGVAALTLPRMTGYEHFPMSGLQKRLAELERRRIALKNAGVDATHARLAEMTSRSPSTVQRIFAREVKRLSADEELEISNALARLEREARARLGRDALEPAAAPLAERPPAPFLHDGGAQRRIPVYGFAGAGSRIALSEDHVVDWLAPEDIAGSGSDPRGAFILEVVGVSMEPRFMQGDRVLVLRDRLPRLGQDCVLERHDGTAELKIYRGHRAGRIHFDQWNEHVPGYDRERMHVAENEIRAMHLVKGVFFA